VLSGGLSGGGERSFLAFRLQSSLAEQHFQLSEHPGVTGPLSVVKIAYPEPVASSIPFSGNYA
jgi:lipopolysaccharide/colanic/teichoic acid biosynthesis glycosyltransferase